MTPHPTDASSVGLTRSPLMGHARNRSLFPARGISWRLRCWRWCHVVHSVTCGAPAGFSLRVASALAKIGGYFRRSGQGFTFYRKCGNFHKSSKNKGPLSR